MARPPIVAAAPAAPLAQTVDGTAASAVPSPPVFVPPFPVENWERYEFLQLLGKGGMGTVYKARNRRLGRIVAPLRRRNAFGINGDLTQDTKQYLESFVIMVDQSPGK